MLHLEEAEQYAIFQWRDINVRKYPMLKYMHSSTSGVKFNNAIAGARAKRAGMAKGVLDIFLPYPNNEYAGLFIELKRPKTYKTPAGKPTKEQLEWIEYLNSVGYKALVCYGATEAINTIKDYLSFKSI